MSSFRRFPSELPDYHNDLGIPPNASRREVKQAFARLAKTAHPDKRAPGQKIDAYEFRRVSFLFFVGHLHTFLTALFNLKP